MMMCNRQREAIYKDRAQILHGDDLKDQIYGFIDEVITSAIDARVAEGHAEDWDFEDLWDALKTIYPVSLTVDDIAEEAGTAPRSPVTCWWKKSYPMLT